ncbi:MAG: hypothetical protein NTW19_14950 [Planctomycetota bacterium]|nr:hypothetical protein [Planctomycetota bacterium]
MAPGNAPGEDIDFLRVDMSRPAARNRLHKFILWIQLVRNDGVCRRSNPQNPWNSLKKVLIPIESDDTLLGMTRQQLHLESLTLAIPAFCAMPLPVVNATKIARVEGRYGQWAAWERSSSDHDSLA